VLRRRSKGRSGMRSPLTMAGRHIDRQPPIQGAVADCVGSRAHADRPNTGTVRIAATLSAARRSDRRVALKTPEGRNGIRPSGA
jgi:hypothetical protein